MKGLIAIALASLILTGCSDMNLNNSSNEKLDTMLEKMDEIQTNLDESNKKIDELESEIEALKNNGTEGEDDEMSSSSVVETEEFKIYTVDANTEEIETFGSVHIYENKTTEEKLTQLCTLLVEEYFKEHEVGIEFEGIDENNIATINLVNEEGWTNYFQGSTGGSISQRTITETILQKEYKGEWIDGVKIKVDGKADFDFNHASFAQTFKRNEE